jgi:hypothetical protein
MSEQGVGEPVRRLLAERVETFEQLEVLVWLCRNRGRSCTRGEIAQVLSQSVHGLPLTMAALIEHGLVVRVGHAADTAHTSEADADAFACSMDAELLPTLIDLVADYDAHLSEMVQLLNQQAFERVRSAVVRRFTDTLPSKKKNG